MDTIKIALAAIAVAGMPAAAGAQARGGFEAGVEAFDYSYRERYDGEPVVWDDGKLFGLRLGYVQRLGKGWFLRAQLSSAAGSVDYRADGTMEEEAGGEEVRLNNVAQGVGQLEIHVGRDFMLSKRTSLTPFAGLGTRVLKDDSGGKVSEGGAFGYDREIVYHYVPVGLALRTPLGKRAAVTFSGQYNWAVSGEVESQFSEIDPETPDVKVDLNGGSGFELSAIADIPIGRDAIRVGPFVRRWNIKQSESFIVANPDDPTEAFELFEPKNRTTEVGLRLSFAF